MSPSVERVPAPFEQIARYYAGEIVSGQIAPGDLIPSSATIMRTWHVARATATKATDRLRAMGLVETVPGKGLRVLDHREAATMTASPDTPVDQPIVAAVVTSELGMLVTWRNDKTPPAGFLSGEIEPGESPHDAMTRECKEEAGLLVTADREIGRRVHPRTGRTMIYISGHPTGRPDVFVGDEEELTAVRWVTLAEADDAFAPFGGMFEPVHTYLAATLPT